MTDLLTDGALKQFEAREIDRNALGERTVAIIGYGSQGRSQALNLRDSGISVVVGVRNLDSESALLAKADGFECLSVDVAAQRAELIMILTPDETHAQLYIELAAGTNLRGKAVGFAHGYAVTYGLIEAEPEIDVILISPKGIGSAVRSRYLEGSGVAALVAVAQDASGQAEKLALAYAAGIGSDRVAIFQTSFAEETVADLFSEQAVIVGGMTELIRAGFETMVNNGIAPEIAYFECVVEAKLILDMIVEQGFAGMFDKISNTAEYGARSAGSRIISPEVRKEMDTLFQEIKAGDFAQSWNAEVAAGSPRLHAFRTSWQRSNIDATASGMRDFLG